MLKVNLVHSEVPKIVWLTKTDQSIVCIDPLQRHLLEINIYPRSIMHEIFHRHSVSVPLLFSTKTDQMTGSLDLKTH